jgi:hypothetical protein
VSDSDNDLERLASHDPRNVDDIADTGVAAVELDQNVCRVSRENTEYDDYTFIRVDTCEARIVDVLVKIPGIRPIVCNMAGRLRMPIPT